MSGERGSLLTLGVNSPGQNAGAGRLAGYRSSGIGQGVLLAPSPKLPDSFFKRRKDQRQELYEALTPALYKNDWEERARVLATKFKPLPGRLIALYVPEVGIEIPDPIVERSEHIGQCAKPWRLGIVVMSGIEGIDPLSMGRMCHEASAECDMTDEAWWPIAQELEPGETLCFFLPIRHISAMWFNKGRRTLNQADISDSWISLE
jgi:hypothetical protein